MNRSDSLVALLFVLAALTEAVVRDHGAPGLLAFEATGAVWLASLAVRRTRPLFPLCAITGVSLVGVTLTALLWPQSPDGPGVWIIAIMLASYSLGAHGEGRRVLLGLLLPAVVVVAADATTRAGWDRVSGILFVTTFVGLVPTGVGRLVRVRSRRLHTLHEQHALILRSQRDEQAAAVLAERLRTVERWQPTLVRGLQALATSAASTGDPAEVEAAARHLLARTREEVVALTAPAEDVALPDVPPADHLAVLRRAAQPWTVLAAGALTAGLSLETTHALEPAGPAWLVVPACLAVGAPLALAWWRPVAALVVAWSVVAAYSRLLAPLDGSLSETAFALAAAFGVALLSRRRTAVLGLLVCWWGQLLGVGTDDLLGEALVLGLSWLGGIAVNEVSRLVEQTRANNELLGRQEAVAAARAVVEERLRLAREIHDALGHSLTVVTLQAGAARRLAATDPERAEEVMRTVAAAARGGVASLALGDGHTDVAGLLARVRETGLVIDADLDERVVLDPVQEVAVFRVVQEALTNVLRHAPGAHANLAVRRGEVGVEITVSNSAPTAPGPGPGTGLGLAGVRARVAACAGQVSWGPRDDGGFEVRAFLPTPSPAVSVR